MIAADSSLGTALETARRKMQHNVDGLHTRFVHFEASRHQELDRVADLITNCCFPGKSLQERELGVAYFLNRYGTELLEIIDSNIEPEGFNHLVLELP
jgi:predicted amidohydrolase YtcJ